MHDFYIILGCFGLETDNFCLCRGVENSILPVNVTVNNYKKLIEYLDSCDLFNRPIFDYNGARNFIFFLQKNFDQVSRPLWPAKKFELYQKFVIDHRNCGIFIRLDLEDIRREKVEFIIKQETTVEETKKPDLKKLTLIRGRR